MIDPAWIVARVTGSLLWMVLLLPTVASGIELRDAELVAGGSPVLSNGSETVRIEDARLGRLGLVPEPGAAWSLLSGAALLTLLSARRRAPRSAHVHSRGGPSMSHWLRVLAACFGLLALVYAAPGFAQVPQDTTFTGRLVDDFGAPLPGPVDIELRVFDAPSAGTELYSEEHLGLLLDATGGFSVQLGMGTSPSGSFDAGLFSDPSRWLEVVVDDDVLSPRQIIGSVPWALVAQQALEVVPDPAGSFKDCGDGTVWDPKTGLQWEKKTGTVGTAVQCDMVSCPDPHEVDNMYTWSGPLSSAPDGGAFTDFLAKLNDPIFGTAATENDVTGCFAGHCDWRLPTIVEIQTILDNCGVDTENPCIDEAFGATWPTWYWSASQVTGQVNTSWAGDFFFSFPVHASKTTDAFARAVRVGSCH